MAKTIFVCLTAAFLSAICTDNDPNHPNGPDVIITQGKGTDRPVFEVAENVYIKEKIREGILEEVRDFAGVVRNSPEHPDHVDNPKNLLPDSAKAPLSAPIVQNGYSEEQFKTAIADALATQSQTNIETQKQAVESAVQRALAAQQEKNKTDLAAALAQTAKPAADVSTK
ncbi:MAG: hypothetical protein ACRYFS_16350 [Janthinobacterium lividum]